jgi:hypothetical protein
MLITESRRRFVEYMSRNTWSAYSGMRRNTGGGSSF